MSFQKGLNFKSMLELWEYLPEDQRTIVDVLRHIVSNSLPSWCKEKLHHNVPFYFGKKKICMIWPASIPGGGIKKGVLFGLYYGNRLKDANHYLTHGTNKQVFYKIFHSPDEIDYDEIFLLLKEAIDVDNQFK